MSILSRGFLLWLPLAISVTGVCLLVYGAVQQNYRQSLNDPQVQMAEDAARALSAGAVPASVIPHGTPAVDIASSLSPYLAVYDDKGLMLESSATLGNAPLPHPPGGVFDAALQNQGKDTSIPGQNRVSWEPTPGLRSAIVTQHFSGTHSGFVVVGRNMREVEKREQQLANFVLVAWIALLATTFFAKIFSTFWFKNIDSNIF